MINFNAYFIEYLGDSGGPFVWYVFIQNLRDNFINNSNIDVFLKTFFSNL